MSGDDSGMQQEEEAHRNEGEAEERSSGDGDEGRRPELDELTGETSADAPGALDMLYDLDVPVAIELGRTRMAVEEILRLGRGSVIQLDRLAGEPIDVFVGDRKFAQGEVVVVGEQFGIRLTRILAPPSRQGAEA